MDGIEIAVRCEAALGECPLWDDINACLYWVDILGGERHVLSDNRHHSETLGAPLPAVVPTTARAWQLVLGRDAVHRATGGSATKLFTRIRLPELDMRFNDAKCDPAGRLWAGTMSTAGRRSASLYCIDEHARVRECLSGLTISNGLGWSPDATSMYHVDTPTGRVDVYTFDIDNGAIGTRRTLAEIPSEAGQPDGLCVDDDGFSWVALWSGSAVRRYTPNGKLDAIYSVPTCCPTSCAFGGADMQTLYVTSSRAGAAEFGADLEHAGSLFQLRAGVTGAPPARFKPGSSELN
jgi:sugar lactone lactonase YvrE